MSLTHLARIRAASIQTVGALVACIAVLLGFVQPAAAHDEYDVQPGDTLSEIARDAGVELDVLMQENGLTNAHHVRIGQTLRIPHAASGASVVSATSYTVRPGDTISHIALRFGVSRSELIAANGLSDGNRIRSGSTLSIPGGGAVASVAQGVYPNLPARLRNDPDRLALIPIFERWASANDIDASLVMAVAWQESGWNNNAVSSVGARGIGQIMPATAEWVAGSLIGDPTLDRANPEDNIRMSARFLDWLINHHGSVDLALAGYYQGPGAVDAGIMYDDTIQYVANVKALQDRFAPG